LKLNWKKLCITLGVLAAIPIGTRLGMVVARWWYNCDGIRLWEWSGYDYSFNGILIGFCVFTAFVGVLVLLAMVVMVGIPAFVRWLTDREGE